MTAQARDTDPAGSAEVASSDNGNVAVRLSGAWVIGAQRPSAAGIAEQIATRGRTPTVTFDGTAISRWDSTLLTFLVAVRERCVEGGAIVDTTDMPEGVRKLLDLASKSRKRESEPEGEADEGPLHRLGTAWHRFAHSAAEAIAFLGDATLGLLRFAGGRARFQRSELWVIIQECGARALPIVSLISVLVGLILAFVGAIQLQQFGAQIFVANLVGIGMAREMGAMMTAIVMAGRTGAAFAAQIGTMQVNEEVDALKTLGISPIDFLVTPRIVALILMMPLLAVYAAALGIVGGLIVGVAMLDITPTQYLLQTQAALSMTDFAVGVVKSVVFGILIAFFGCLRGMQCGRSASAVGGAATSAVVAAIVAIVLADGLFAVVTNVVGI